MCCSIEREGLMGSVELSKRRFEQPGEVPSLVAQASEVLVSICSRTFSAVAQALVVRCAGGEYAELSLVDRLPHRSAALPPLEGSHSWWS